MRQLVLVSRVFWGALGSVVTEWAENVRAWTAFESSVKMLEAMERRKRGEALNEMRTRVLAEFEIVVRLMCVLSQEQIKQVSPEVYALLDMVDGGKGETKLPTLQAARSLRAQIEALIPPKTFAMFYRRMSPDAQPQSGITTADEH